MTERLLTQQENRIILGAEEPRRRWKWNWKKAAYNLYVVVAYAFVIAVLTHMGLALVGAVRVTG